MRLGRASTPVQCLGLLTSSVIYLDNTAVVLEASKMQRSTFDCVVRVEIASIRDNHRLRRSHVRDCLLLSCARSYMVGADWKRTSWSHEDSIVSLLLCRLLIIVAIPERQSRTLTSQVRAHGWRSARPLLYLLLLFDPMFFPDVVHPRGSTREIAQWSSYTARPT